MTTLDQYIIKEYLDGRSPYEISEKLGKPYNHMRIRKILINAGIILRSKSEAQKTALQSGRAKSPKQKGK